MFASRYKTIDRATGREVAGAFVLLPESDSAARTAIAAYAEATDNAALARLLRLWLVHLHRMRCACKIIRGGRGAGGVHGAHKKK